MLTSLPQLSESIASVRTIGRWTVNLTHLLKSIALLAVRIESSRDKATDDALAQPQSAEHSASIHCAHLLACLEARRHVMSILTTPNHHINHNPISLDLTLLTRLTPGLT